MAGVVRSLIAVAIGFTVAVGAAFGQTLNPTGRAIDLNVPLFDDKRRIGVVSLHMTADDRLFVPGPGLRALIKPVLNDEALEKLAALEDADKRIDLSAIPETGISIEYLPARLALILSAPPEARPTTAFGLGRKRSGAPTDITEPEPFSAAVVIRIGAGFEDVEGGDTSIDWPVVDLDATMRLGGPVLESEFTIGTEKLNDIGVKGGKAFQRRGTRFVIDFPEQPLRAIVGDVYYSPVGFQGSADILGFSLTKRYSILQPSKLIRPRADRQFTLTRPSTVLVRVNGVVIRRLNLDPGVYDLQDIPLSDGVNDIEIDVVSDTGQMEKTTFSQFYRGDLLAVGILEFNVSSGVLSVRENGELDYDMERFTTSAWVEYGATEEITLGANVQFDDRYLLIGSQIRTSTLIGQVTLDGAGSMIKGTDGNIYTGLRARGTIDSEVNVYNWRLGQFGVYGDVRSADFAHISEEDPETDIELEYGAIYSIGIHPGVFMSIGGSQRFGQRDGDDTLDVFTSFSGIGPLDSSWSISGNYTNSSSPDEEDEYNVLFGLSFKFDGVTSSTSYETKKEELVSEVATSGGAGVGAWSASLGVKHDFDDDESAVTARGSYAHERFTSSFSHDSSFSELDGSSRVSATRFRFGTAIAFAPNHLAVGRPFSGSFAIVVADESLDGAPVLLNPTRDGSYEASTSKLGPALVGGLGAYAPRSIAYSAPELSAGKSIGSGFFYVEPPYSAGYILRVATEAEITAIGVLKDDLGRNVSLVSGTATKRGDAEAAPIAFFTNKSGRFAIIAKEPGEYELRLNSSPPQKAIVKIQSDKSLVRLGDIQTTFAE